VKESWRNVALLLLIAAGMKPDDGQTDVYRLADFMSGYRLFKSIAGYQLTSLVTTFGNNSGES